MTTPRGLHLPERVVYVVDYTCPACRASIRFAALSSTVLIQTVMQGLYESIGRLASAAHANGDDIEENVYPSAEGKTGTDST